MTIQIHIGIHISCYSVTLTHVKLVQSKLNCLREQFPSFFIFLKFIVFQRYSQQYLFLNYKIWAIPSGITILYNHTTNCLNIRFLLRLKNNPTCSNLFKSLFFNLVKMCMWLYTSHPMSSIVFVALQMKWITEIF